MKTNPRDAPFPCPVGTRVVAVRDIDGIIDEGTMGTVVQLMPYGPGVQWDVTRAGRSGHDCGGNCSSRGWSRGWYVTWDMIWPRLPTAPPVWHGRAMEDDDE